MKPLETGKPKTSGQSPSATVNRSPSQKISKDEQREAARLRKQASRLRRLARENPEAAKAEAEAKARTEAEKIQQETAQKMADEARAQKTRLQLNDAFAGIIQVTANGARKLWFEPTDPELGNVRARRMAEPWVEILLPYISESNIKYLPLIFAAAGTVGAVQEWVAEIEAHRKLSTPKKQQEDKLIETA